MGFDFFFIGLNQIGASIGLSLAETELEIRRVGHDPDGKLARRAHQIGAVDQLVPHPRKASTVADVVILSVPPTEVRDYLEMLGEKLKTDSLVLDTAPFKAPAVAWAKELLPKDRHYIGATPIIGPEVLLAEPPGLQAPRADLFQGGVIALVIPPGTPEKTVNLVLRLVNELKATPFFLDPTEHDAVMTTVETLPQLITTALMQMAAQAHNWREIQRMAGSTFANATKLGITQSPKTDASSLLLNQETILHKLDALSEEWQKLRSLITSEDDEALAEYLAEATASRGSWLNTRRHGDWEGQERTSARPFEPPGFLQRFLGVRPRKRKDQK